MANSIDFTTLAVGALIGMGCRKQLKACGRIAANTAASLAEAAATAATQVAEETSKSQSPEAVAAQQRIEQLFAQAGQTGNGQKNG